MRLVRVGLGSIDTTVGAFRENTDRALALAQETAVLETVFVIGVSVLHDGLRYNCAATVAGGSVRSLTPKEKLPTYNVFYEGRTVSRGVPGAFSEVRGVPF